VSPPIEQHPPTEPPPQRRDNGLPATQFVALADVDPRLGEHLLDLLKFADIAAYLEPTGDPLVAARYPAPGPVERLYVDTAQRSEAREVVLAAAEEAGAPVAAEPALEPAPVDVLAGMDTDAEFARIMAGFDLTASPEREPMPKLDGAALDAQADLMAEQDQRRQDAADEAELAQEHFEPPPPPPFPIPKAPTVGGVALILLGIFVIGWGGLIGLYGAVTLPLGIISILAGAAVLVTRLRDSAEDDIEPDDGAIL
jgi:hypothetical protein